jgi:hypothetical protein
MMLFSVLTAGILAALHGGVGAKTDIQERNSGGNEYVLLEDTVFWGRAVREVYMSLTPAPTPSPTPRPTPSPTRIEITCTSDNNGRDCTDLETPKPECDKSVDTLAFTFIGGDCDQNINTQDEFFCQDSDGGPSDDDAARIKCEDEDGRDIFNDVVAIGSQITLGDRDDLPDEIMCSVMNNQGAALQTFNIGTTSQDDLFLKDVFGSLQLESCDRLNCLIDVTYVYTIQNDGSTDLEITEVERSREGISDDLIDSIQDTNLRPDENTSAEENAVIDVCVHTSIVTVVEAIGEPPSGIPGSAEDTYVVDVDGLPDREIPSPCSGKGKGKLLHLL